MTAERDAKGKFTKGHKKTGGMQKGYETPVKKEFRELMADYSRENFDTEPCWNASHVTSVGSISKLLSSTFRCCNLSR